MKFCCNSGLRKWILLKASQYANKIQILMIQQTNRLNKQEHLK